MNQLAHLIYRILRGEEERQAGLSEIEKSALADLQLGLRQNPNDLADWLAQEQTPPEEWLILPSIVSIQPRS
jgi:hypothetical protein